MDSLLPRICAVDAVGIGATRRLLRTPCLADKESTWSFYCPPSKVVLCFVLTTGWPKCQLANRIMYDIERLRCYYTSCLENKLSTCLSQYTLLATPARMFVYKTRKFRLHTIITSKIIQYVVTITGTNVFRGKSNSVCGNTPWNLIINH